MNFQSSINRHGYHCNFGDEKKINTDYLNNNSWIIQSTVMHRCGLRQFSSCIFLFLLSLNKGKSNWILDQYLFHRLELMFSVYKDKINGALYQATIKKVYRVSEYVSPDPAYYSTWLSWQISDVIPFRNYFWFHPLILASAFSQGQEPNVNYPGQNSFDSHSECVCVLDKLGDFYKISMPRSSL